MTVLQGNVDRLPAETDVSPSVAMQTEAAVHSETRVHPNTATGRRRIVFRHDPMRKAWTGIDAVLASRPCVRVPDAPGEVMLFPPAVLPDFPHDARFVGEALPWLHPGRFSNGDFPETLAEFSEPDMRGIAEGFFIRLGVDLCSEFEAGLFSDPSMRHNFPFWIYGVGLSAHPDHHRHCLSVVIGAAAQGGKEGIGLVAGCRERVPVWRKPLPDLSLRGLENGLERAVGEGASVFRKVLHTARGNTRELCHWVPKSGNVYNRAPEFLQVKSESRPYGILVIEIRELEAMRSQTKAMRANAVGLREGALIRARDLLPSGIRAAMGAESRLREFLMTGTKAMEAMNLKTRAIRENTDGLREGALFRTRYLLPPGIRAAIDAESRLCTILMTRTRKAEARKSLTEAIREHARQRREGALIRARDLLHLGNRGAIDKALSRLAEQGQFLRISRGIYVRTLECEFGRYAPSTEKVIKSIAKATGETIMPHAAIGAKNWGLTTQVPLRISFITSGRERTLKFGGLNVRLSRAPSWQFDVGNRAAGQALRALDWIGPKEATNALRTLKGKLSASDFQEMRRWASILHAKLPPWLSRQVTRVSVNG